MGTVPSQQWGSFPKPLQRDLEANLSLCVLAIAPNELSWGSPKPCRQSWEEDFTGWGCKQARG